MNNDNLAGKLLTRGDIISIDKGRLIIKPASGRDVPEEWMRNNNDQIISEIIEQLGIIAYQYISYKTGKYPPHFAAGVTLQLINITHHEGCYTIFNVDLTRARTTKHGKKGALLPDDHFRITRNYDFYKFWSSTGIKMPKLSSFHDRMGKLKKIIFTGEITKGERLKSSTMKPVCLTANEIKNAFDSINNTPNVCLTISQAPDNSLTKVSDKEAFETQQLQGISSNQSTGAYSHGKKVTSKKENKTLLTKPYKPNTDKISVAPQDQSVNEWLMDYESHEKKSRYTITH